MRNALYMPALVAIRHNPICGKYTQIIDAGKPPKLAIAAIMRKLVILANTCMQGSPNMDRSRALTKTDNFWLAIPTEAAGRGLRGGKITPGEWERRRGLRLRFVYRRRRPSLLVADMARLNTRGQAVASRAKTGRGQVTAPIFLLVPQVKLPKRLDLARDAERAHDAVPGLVVANWVEGRL